MKNSRGITSRRKIRTDRSAACSSQPDAARGFTLMEVLVTTILSTTLLMGLWTIFGTYLKLFESGQARAEQSQLRRALTRQLTDDLRAVIPGPAVDASPSSQMPSDPLSHGSSSEPFDPTAALSAVSTATVPNGNPPVTSSGNSSNTDINRSETTVSLTSSTSTSSFAPLPSFGLSGTEDSLRLDVLQVAPLQPTLMSDAEQEIDSELLAMPLAAELRTILYTFRPPDELVSSDEGSVSGLIRQEFDWESAASGRNPSTASGVTTPTASPSRESTGGNLADLSPEELREAEATDDTIMWVPELVGLEFRYFDGQQWWSQWDSRQKGRLPTAVEVAMQFQPPMKSNQTGRRSASNRRSETTTVNSAASESTTESTQDGEPALPVFRHFVYLPLAAMPEESHAFDAASAAPLTTSGSLWTGASP